MKALLYIFGLIGGFVLGSLASKNMIGGGVGAVIGMIIFGAIGNSLTKKAVITEANALSGKRRNPAKAIFWWFVLLIILAAAIILIALASKS